MRKKNKNLCYVTIRQDRFCKHCNELIPKGTRCITVNKCYEERAWYCSECVRLINNIAIAKAQLNKIPYGDEGGYLAGLEYLGELEADFYERGV